MRVAAGLCHFPGWQSNATIIPARVYLFLHSVFTSPAPHLIIRNTIRTQAGLQPESTVPILSGPTKTGRYACGRKALFPPERRTSAPLRFVILSRRYQPHCLLAASHTVAIQVIRLTKHLPPPPPPLHLKSIQEARRGRFLMRGSLVKRGNIFVTEI